jgi:hypothetical protein
MALTGPAKDASAVTILFISVHIGFPIGVFLYACTQDGYRGSEKLVHNTIL